MTARFFANCLGYASLGCSFSPWLGLILIHLRGASGLLHFPGVWWLAIQGVGVCLGVAATIGASRLWLLATALALGNFFLVMYVVGS